ncbi:MAG: type I polyketide synthase, partial [Anaerolineae bacterium]|nr:type I polyketide synthase [Anaerolineae bacterium]
MSEYGNIDRAVAVVGVSAILPDAPDAQTFWQNLQGGRYSITDVDPDRWDPADYYDPDPQAVDKSYTKIGGWVRQYEFEPFKWRIPIPPNVSKSIDVAQKWAISSARAALLDYGWPDRPLDMARTGVIVGNAMSGENHYITSLRIYTPEFLHALEAVPEFASLPPDVRLALIGGATQQVRSRIADITEDTMPGELANIIAGRVANTLDLGGPNFVTDAACASSFAALEAAVRGLHAGHFNAVLTGGVDRNMGASTFVKFCKIGALSPDGSRPFDADANGFVMGEGAAMFLLKRLADAERDGDRIYAVIRGVGGASDGKGKGITAPNPAGQAQAILRAWQDAGLSPATASYIEAHGTSTRVGDVAEVEGMLIAFREFNLPVGQIPVGSVKSNIGHLKGGAGAASLLKTVLSLHHRQLAPSLNVHQLNPKIDFASLPFRINTTLSPWERNGVPRRAGVSSFGFGGTNFHVVVEEHLPGMLDRSKSSFAGVQVPTGQPKGAGPASSRPVVLEAQPTKAPYRGALLIGGANAAELKSRLEAVLEDVRRGKLPLRQAPSAQDLGAAERLAIDFGNADELLKRGEKALGALEKDVEAMWKPLAGQGIFRGRGTPGRIALMFPGQGSQYANMLKELRDTDSIVANTFLEADAVMTPLLGQPLTSYIFTENDDKERIDAAEEKLKDTTITQPAVLTVNVALTRLLQSYGIAPDMVIGHSLGEYAALVAAGVLPFADALHVVSARGREMSKVSMADNGCMAAVMAPLAEVEKVLAGIDGYVVLANVNSPNQIVIGGETPAIDKAIAAFQAQEFRAVKIPVSHAFHTKIVAPASEPLKQVIARMDVQPPQLPIVANVTGDLYPQSRDEIIDLLGRQVASPVQFVKGVDRLYALGARMFVEVGPKRVLTALSDEILKEQSDVTSLFTNHPRKGTLPSFNECLCGLWAAGIGAGQPVEQIASIQVQPAPQPAPVQAELPNYLTTQQPILPTTQLPPDRLLALGQLFAEFLAHGQQIYSGGIPTTQPPNHQALRSNATTQPPLDGRLPLTGSVVISGAALGLPGQDRHVFAGDNIERILRGEQFIDLVSYRQRVQMATRRITRLVKSEAGATFQVIDDPADTIKLAGRRGHFDLVEEFGVPAERVEALDITTQLAIAAGIDALRDA